MSSVSKTWENEEVERNGEKITKKQYIDLIETQSLGDSEIWEVPIVEEGWYCKP